MVQRLRELVENTVKNERELAISQEKLAHSEELHAMNMTLEDRLKEIEYLNINLEERIEEIEEANYKIADLASELEEKNIGLSQAVDRLQALYKMGLAVNATMELDKLLNVLSQKSMETMKAQVGYILMLNEKTGNLHRRWRCRDFGRFRPQPGSAAQARRRLLLGDEEQPAEARRGR